ncbi:MAG: CoA-binding protein [Candidatus Omnitrophica bacterium]|nr:CoA-binding protein [Candidatus Omnitrophota bacterium]
MENLVKDFLNQESFAVVGSFRNETKYAYRIFKKLKEKGYNVFPVNPRGGTIDENKCYPSIKDIPENIDVANIVTSPAVTINIVKECKQKGIKRVWIQPGAEDKEVIDFCKQNNINLIYSLCVMLETI